MALNYPPFAACAALVRAASNSPPLARGSVGMGVALVQAALVQLKESLPISTRSGAPDGIFGDETAGAVVSFQRKSTLKPDGIVGEKTMHALDDAMAKSSPPLPPSPSPKPVFPSTEHYEVGTGDPPLSHDPGAGLWDSKPTELAYLAMKQGIIEILPTAGMTIGWDAAKHMAHYLNNTGSALTIDLEGMVKDVTSARARFQDEVAQAQEFVESLPPGRWSIHSRKGENGYNRQAESTNWYFAIGGYTKWGQGVATVKPGSQDLELEFEYKFYDRYNWDRGKSVTIGGIKVTDQFMGEFHRQGIAKEFDCFGSFKRRFKWRRGFPIPPSQLDPGGGR